MCYEAIGLMGGKYTALEPPSVHVKYIRRDIIVDWVLAVTLFGRPVKLNGVYGRPAMPADRLFSAQFYALAETLVKQGLLRPPPFQVRPGGLEAVEEGIEELRTGQALGGKLVFPLA